MDSDRDWVTSPNKSALKGRLALAHPPISTVGSDEVVGVGMAGTVPGSVGVGGLRLDSVPDSLPEPVHPTSIARSLTTVNSLLLGHADQLSPVLLPHALQGTSGGEGPAGAALALVLDGGHLTLLPVVKVGWGVGQGLEVSDRNGAHILRNLGSQHSLLELLLGPVGVLPSLELSIVGVHHLLVGCPNVEPDSILLGGVSLAMAGLEGSPFFPEA